MNMYLGFYFLGCLGIGLLQFDYNPDQHIHPFLKVIREMNSDLTDLLQSPHSNNFV